MKLLPSLKQLEYLVALADTLHFGRASERCNITPSTLSAGIRDLEHVVGVALAERTKRHVLMTPIGNEIADRARRLLRDTEDIMDLAAANREPMTGDMRLGVIPTISPFLLPRVLPKLNRRYPGLRLFLREERTDALLARVRSGDIDVALIALPYDTGDLVREVLFEDPFEFACARRHPLARADSISLEPLLLLEEGHCLRGHALDACQLTEGRIRAQFEASSLHTLVQMVAADLGVTLLPKLALDAHITRGCNIKQVPLSRPASRDIGLVWRQTSERAQEFRLLGGQLSALAD